MFTLDQVFVLIGLFCLITLLATAWITALIVIRNETKEADRRIEDLRQQFEVNDLAHAEILQQVLRGGELLGNRFTVDHASDWAYGTDRVTQTFNNVLEFLQCIDKCRQQNRTVFYTRINGLTVSN